MSYVDLTLPGEIWKPDVMTGIPGLMVSSLGRVRSSDRWVRPLTNSRTWGPRLIPGRILRQFSLPSGHKITSLSLDNVSRKLPVHRLVCGAFHGPPPMDKAEACHENNNPADNRPENLRWDTHAANMRDTIRHGTSQRGERSTRSKLTDEFVILFRKAAVDGVFIYDLPEAEGIANNTIWNAVNGRTWKHLPHFGPGGSPVRTRLKGYAAGSRRSQFKPGYVGPTRS